MGHLCQPPKTANEYGVYQCVHCHNLIIPNDSNSGWTTKWGTGTVQSGLDYYKTLSLKELRRRQDLTRQQQKLLYEQAERDNFAFSIIRHRAYVNLETAEQLLTWAVMDVYCPA